MSKMKLKNYICDILYHHKITQGEFAKSISITRQGLGNILSGRNNPSAVVWNDMAREISRITGKDLGVVLLEMCETL